MAIDSGDETIDINTKAPIHHLKELFPKMKSNRLEADDVQRGHVLIFSSRSIDRALPNLSVYTAAKGAVKKLVEAVRSEYACLFGSALCTLILARST